MGMSPEDIKQNFTDLDYTQGIRKQLIEVVKVDALKKDPDAIAATAKLLDGMDKVSIGRLRINEKDKENSTHADEAAAMAQFLLGLSGKRQRGEGPGTTRGVSEVPGSKLPESKRPNYDKSILDTSNSGETAGEFKERMDRKG